MSAALAVALALADVDAAYGRIDGDVALAASAGVAVGPGAPRLLGDLRVRYLQTIGLFGTIEGGPSAEPRSVLAFGAEVRPLFFARWGTGYELGSPRLDLLIDSFALELGTAFVHPEGAKMRPALQAGLGLELPFFSQATGLFLALHAGARWSDNALAGNALGGPSDRATFLALSFGWQQIMRGHIVDLGDPREAAR